MVVVALLGAEPPKKSHILLRAGDSIVPRPYAHFQVSPAKPAVRICTDCHDGKRARS